MKRWKHILFLCAVLTALLCVTAYATDDAMPIQIRGKPTVSDGRPIDVTTLDGLKEMVVPVQVSLDTPTETMFFALFYGGDGKFIGGGMTAATVDSQTSFVIMPVQTNVTGAETLKMLVTDTAFRPLSDTPEYSLTGGGGGGSGGVPYNPSLPAVTYYLRTAADMGYENGGYGMAYFTETEPTPETTFSEMSASSALFQHEVRARSCGFTYYVILNPGAGSELTYPRIIQGDASYVRRVNVTLNAAPSAVVYCISAWSSATTDLDAPTVTIKSAFQGNGSGGGGSSGGSYVSMSYYANANAAAVSENGGSGYVYVSQSRPTEGMTLPQGRDSITLSGTKRNVTFYAVFTPEVNSAFVEPPTLTGSETLGEVSVINAYSANGTAVKSYVFPVTVTGSTSLSSAPTVTVSATFTGTGGGGGSEPARGV